ncbi:hypothetical protein AMJ57_04165 [Parcubacteria bacterium SG8_24]|nr:MAG: hypothetical protein AMJ57_04165 [Parcubacteria bacterium SG8_24]
MPRIPTLLELLQAGVHFGHRVSRRHPKTDQFIFGARNGIHIIDLNKTMSRLKETLESVSDIAARGGVILFVGTKKQAREIVKKAALDCGMPYVTSRWLGGTLTNYNEVFGMIKRYNELKEERDTGKLSKYTKKEQSRFIRFLEDTEEKVGGITDMKRPPDALFVIDIKKERTAVREANTKGIPVIALIDTNVNPDLIAHGIPSNDDAVKTIDLMTRLVAEAVKEGKERRGQEQAGEERQPEQQKQPAAAGSGA